MNDAKWPLIGCKKCPKFTHQKNGNLVFHNPITKKTDYTKFNVDESPEFTILNYLTDMYKSNVKTTNEKYNIDVVIDAYKETYKDKYSKLSIRTKTIIFKSFCKKLNYTTINEIKIEDVQSYIEKDINKKSTKNNQIVNFNSFLDYLNTTYKTTFSKLKVIEYNRNEKIVNKNAGKYCTIEEVNTIIECAKKYSENMYTLFIIGFHAGLRYAEIMNLEWNDINFNNRLLKVQNKYESKSTKAYTTKSGINRIVPVSSTLNDYLVTLKETNKGYVKNDYVIVGDFKFRNYTTLRYEVLDFQKTLKTAYPKFDYITPHVARHTFASHAASNGISIFKISKWLGHANINITARVYAHLIPDSDNDIDKIYK